MAEDTNGSADSPAECVVSAAELAENGIRLGKRLTYLLRYGAEKEGLEVSSNGYVKLDDLMTVPLLHRHTKEEVLKEVETSESSRGTKRFAQRTVNGEVSVRATYGHRFERNPFHDGTKVPRLLEQCMNYISSKIAFYSLEDCPDEYLIGQVIHKLKRQKRLTNKALNSLLGPYIENLDLDGTYLTVKSLKIIVEQCPNLRHLNLKDCGYLMTDQLVLHLVKNLPALNSLNLYACNHITSTSLKGIAKHLGNRLVSLNISRIPNFTSKDILYLIERCPRLKFLDFHGGKIEQTVEFCTALANISETRDIEIFHN